MIPILTIDGPSGVGKGTVARIIAEKQGWNLLDSGAIYRAFALAINTHNVDIKNEHTLQQLAQTLNLTFKIKANDKLVNIYLDNVEVSKTLRTEKTGEMASKIATIDVVRSALLKRQQNFAQMPGLVADGRDMGTTVFPNAHFKVFLTASANERSNRRLKQLQVQGHDGIISQILAKVTARDKRDSLRQHSPLQPAKDALIIDTTELSIDEVITKVITLVKA